MVNKTADSELCFLLKEVLLQLRILEVNFSLSGHTLYLAQGFHFLVSFLLQDFYLYFTACPFQKINCFKIKKILQYLVLYFVMVCIVETSIDM